MRCLGWVLLVFLLGCGHRSATPESPDPESPGVRLRVATFNVSFFGDTPDSLLQSLRIGDQRVRQVAAVLQQVRPDLVLLNEFDYHESPEAVSRFQAFLREAQPLGGEGIDYPYHYAGPVNTGVPSGLDLDGDGRTDGPADAWGFGAYPGQYGMLVLSRYPIDAAAVRSFREFRWAAMPGALRPQVPGASTSFYPEPIWQQLKLSSKSHWDVPVQTPLGTVHLLTMHPTPPVFDGPEDRNGRRNHDEIRLFADYIDPARAGYLVDDQGQSGGLNDGAAFVIVGDLNADPADGDAYPGAIAQLLEHPRIDANLVPASAGALEKARLDGAPNDQHRGPAQTDTADFSEPRSGNMRIDYVLPSRTLRVLEGGVFWPATDEPSAVLAKVSDHHLVWLDLMLAD